MTDPFHKEPGPGTPGTPKTPPANTGEKKEWVNPKCRGCGEEIKFIKTPKGKYIPVNLEEIIIVLDTGAIAKGYISHFATCPEADQFKKGAKKNG